ncbi:energy-coupling factor ABC transporter ATP-binding protein [Thermodesulfobacteriota bacterium]
MVRLERVSYSYPSRKTYTVLVDLTVEIGPLSWTTIVGPDGSGKTTLAKLIKGILKPDDGSVSVGGGDPGTDVGYLGGDPYDSIVGTSVEDDIVFGLENLCLPPCEMQSRLDRALKWTGLTGMESRLCHTLSGGEQQKLALAGVLAMGCKVLVLDEALSMQDRSTRLLSRGLIRSLIKDPGLTVIEISNQVEDALTADRVLFFTEGAISFQGSPEEFVTSSEGIRWMEMAGGLNSLLAALAHRGGVRMSFDGSIDVADGLVSNIKAKWSNYQK